MEKNTLTAIDEYVNKVFVLVLLLVPGACQCAGITYTLEKIIGWLPSVNWVALIVFDITCLFYLSFCIYLIRTGFKDGVVKPEKLRTGKIFIVVIMLIQFNFILYMNPSSEFWGFAFFFVILTSFFFDCRMVGACIIEIAGSLLISWIVNGTYLLPVKNEFFLPNMVNRVICVILSLISIYIVAYFIGHFLVNAKKDEMERNNERVQNVLVTVREMSNNLSQAGVSLSDISSNESASAQELAITCEELLSNSNDLEAKTGESITNLNELKKWQAVVSSNVEKVEQTSQNLLNKSKDNEQLLSSLQSINTEVVDSMESTKNVARNLSEAVKEIGVTLKLINEISASTNLLALNASIEAARAGEAGKGFAVVAHEVGNLANSTKESLDEVETVIARIQNNVNEMTNHVEENAEKLTKQNEHFCNVFSGIQEMIDSLHRSMNDIDTMSDAHNKQADVIRNTVAISENIIESIQLENQKFSNINSMVESNTEDIMKISEQINIINSMAEEINDLLTEHA